VLALAICISTLVLIIMFVLLIFRYIQWLKLVLRPTKLHPKIWSLINHHNLKRAILLSNDCDTPFSDWLADLFENKDDLSQVSNITSLAVSEFEIMLIEQRKFSFQKVLPYTLTLCLALSLLAIAFVNEFQSVPIILITVVVPLLALAMSIKHHRYTEDILIALAGYPAQFRGIKDHMLGTQRDHDKWLDQDAWRQMQGD